MDRQHWTADSVVTHPGGRASEMLTVLSPTHRQQSVTKRPEFAVTSLPTSDVCGEERFVITFKKNPASADPMLMQSALLSA